MRSERIVLLRSFKERNVLLRSGWGMWRLIGGNVVAYCGRDVVVHCWICGGSLLKMLFGNAKTSEAEVPSEVPGSNQASLTRAIARCVHCTVHIILRVEREISP